MEACAVSDPKTLEEFNAKFTENTRYFGSGLETGMSVPCGFCAEPDFMQYKILDVESAMLRGATCKHCGRGIRSIFMHSGNLTRFEIVQTCGDDPPDFLPKLRRAEK